MNIYIHDYSGIEISEDAYRALPSGQRSNYQHKGRTTTEIVSDAVVDLAVLNIVGNIFDSSSGDDCSIGSMDSSSGFDGGFGGGDFSGGGSGSDW